MTKPLKSKFFRVFEHQAIRIGETIDGSEFQERDLELIQAFYTHQKVFYFKLISKGIKFTNYVGMLQIGHLTFEILPKIDRLQNDELPFCQNILIQMLTECGIFTDLEKGRKKLGLVHFFT